MVKKAAAKEPVTAPRLKSSAILDTRLDYRGDSLEQLAKLPDACLDLIYIDPPFNSNRNYEFFGVKPRRSARLMTVTSPRPHTLIPLKP